jgi:cell wall-associated NlpC family hydrolase
LPPILPPRAAAPLLARQARPARRAAACTLRACAAGAALALSLACPAQPLEGAARSPADPVLQLLIDKGLLEADGRGEELVRQVRDRASEMVMAAMNFLGVPYRRGGNSVEQGFDCSGFTRHVFEMSVGLILPRRVDDQASASGLFKVTRDELRPGDLVFFNTLRRTFSHVGIYVGDGKFIHAPRAGSQVRIEDMRQAYWAKRFTGARRAEMGEAGVVAAPAALR